MSHDSLPPRMTAPGPLRGLYLLLLFAALGAFVGAAVGGLEVRSQDYLDLGLKRNAYLTLQESAALGAAWGAALSLLALFAHHAALGLVRSAGRVTWAAVGRTRLTPYIAVLSGALVTVALLPIVRGSVRPSRAWALVAGVALWAALRVLWRQAARGGRGDRLLRLLDLSPPVLFLGLLLLDRYRLSQVLRTEAAVVTVGLLLAALLYHRTAIRPAGSEPLPGWAWLAVLPVALPAMLALGTSRLAPSPTAPLGVKNVVLIGIDTLRWDHAPSGGDAAIARDVTPNLSRLAERGTLFRTAISQAPWTLPAFSSILTGKYPRQHGAYSTWSVIGDSQVTLAEALREAGYRTGGVVSHVFVDEFHGFAQGFDSFDDSNALGHWQITAREVTDEAVGLVNRLTGEPFFLFVHYFDPHYEYRDHPDRPWAERYTNWLSGHRLDIPTLLRYRHALDAADLGYLRDLYREEVAFTDAQIGRLLDELEREGLLDSTAIVVVADHGEEFMEHGWIGHSVSLYDELLRVPLIVALPAGKGVGRVLDRTVETRSVHATVLDLLGVAPLAGASVGPSLLPLVTGAETPEPGPGDRAAFSEIRVPDAAFATGKREIAAAVRQGDWKLVLDIERDRTYLFDLAADPGEKVNVQSAEPQRAAQLRRLLDEWLAEMDASGRAGVERTVDEETVEKLRALGYL